MNAHEFIILELEFGLNNPYMQIEDEMRGMVGEKDDPVDNEAIEEVDGKLTTCELRM